MIAVADADKDKVDKSRCTPVWPVAHPLAAHVSDQKLYATTRRALYDPVVPCWLVSARGKLSFRSFMNALPLQQTARIAPRLSLSVEIKASGSGWVSLLHETPSGCERLASARIADKELELRLDVPDNIEREGFLYLEFVAIGELNVAGFTFITHALPTREVTLGIVVTTFNRPALLHQALRALAPLTEAGIDVTVINNGNALGTLPPGFMSIDSPNLGGAGGFARGLLHYLDAGRVSHVMFMDDDALCHPVSVMRSCALLSFATKENAAVAGAMMYSHAPCVQYELAATIGPYGVTSINQDLDLSEFSNVLANQTAARPDYGAWWFFVFPLDVVKSLPFPFFVRGDDITFSLQNRFSLYSLNSVAAWQPSFNHKVSTASEYLTHRSFLLMPLLTAPSRWRDEAVVNGFRAACAAEIESYRYPIAEAMLCACQDVLLGPDFWHNEANTLARLEQLKDIEARFTARSLRPSYKPLLAGHRDRFVVRLLRRLSRWIPGLSRLRVRAPAVIADMTAAPWRTAFRSGMLYRPPDGKTQMATMFDAAWRRSLYHRLESLSASYQVSGTVLAHQYGAGSAQSRATWLHKFGATP